MYEILYVSSMILAGYLVSRLWDKIEHWRRVRRVQGIVKSPIEGMGWDQIKALADLEREFPTGDPVSLAAVAHVEDCEKRRIEYEDSVAQSEFDKKVKRTTINASYVDLHAVLMGMRTQQKIDPDLMEQLRQQREAQARFGVNSSKLPDSFFKGLS